MSRKGPKRLERSTQTRDYRPICWIGTEGQTERDYFSMDAFRDGARVPKIPKDRHPNRTSPSEVLKKFRKAMEGARTRRGDSSWIVVDVDDWGERDFEALSAWAEASPDRHLAVSNPKFELFLLMHFDPASGCTTAAKVDDRLRNYMPAYRKRLGRAELSEGQVRTAIANAGAKRAAHPGALPGRGATDAHLLAREILDG